MPFNSVLCLYYKMQKLREVKNIYLSLNGHKKTMCSTRCPSRILSLESSAVYHLSMSEYKKKCVQTRTYIHARTHSHANTQIYSHMYIHAHAR